MTDLASKDYQKKTEHEQFIQDVDETLQKLRTLLLEKNRKYGNSALKPIGIFAEGGATSSINVRIDDKLSRIANQQEDEDEDAPLDLIGYLILREISLKYRLQK